MNFRLPPGNYVAEPTGEEQSCPFTVDAEGAVHWYDGTTFLPQEDDSYLSILPPPRELHFTVPGEHYDVTREPEGIEVGDWRPV